MFNISYKVKGNRQGVYNVVIISISWWCSNKTKPLVAGFF